MINRILLIVLATFSFALNSYTELKLVAITHSHCPACQAWHKYVADGYPGERSGLPSLTIYDVSNKGDLQWVQSHISNAYLRGLPTFVLMQGIVVKDSFTGFYGKESFYKTLNDKLELYQY